MKLQTFFAFDPADSDERRVEKFAIFLVAAGLGWVHSPFATAPADDEPRPTTTIDVETSSE